MTSNDTGTGPEQDANEGRAMGRPRNTGPERVRITLTAATWYWLIRTGDCMPALYKAVSSQVTRADDRSVTIDLSQAAARWVRRNTKGDSV